MQNNHLHVIGICGVATSAIAIAFKKFGWTVTGSDKGFFPPVSTELEEHGIEFYAGWHPENIARNGINPTIIMTGGSGTSASNPETIYARENNVPIFDFPAVLQQYFIKKNSIVTVGTWGKTTSSSLLSFILIQAGMNPSYFTGGLSLSHDTGAITDSDWSVVEGDEYQVSISDRRPKFVYYGPTHLLLTSVSWDHADLYPTEQAYFDEFKSLVNRIPANGMIVACTDEKGVLETVKDKKIISYGKNDVADFKYQNILHTKNGLDFEIVHAGNTYKIHSPMLGKFNAENIAGVFAMAYSIGISPEAIIKAINDFKGIKRRFERRYEAQVTVLDCHAPTPEKALSVLESVREVYDKKIIAIYEPNIGGRHPDSAYKYDNAFANADVVIIPRLTKLKVSEEKHMEGEELMSTIKKTKESAVYIEDDTELIKYIISNTQKDDVIVFLGSHGFRGMIEETITSLRQQSL